MKKKSNILLKCNYRYKNKRDKLSLLATMSNIQKKEIKLGRST